jgi:hypothetical protein
MALKESNIIDSLAHSERPKEACAYMSPLSLEETPSQDHMKVETNNESIFAYIYIYTHNTGVHIWHISHVLSYGTCT